MENTAAEFVQPQISRRRLRADHAASRSGAIVFCVLEFVHQKKFYQNTTVGPLYPLAPLTFTMMARRKIKEISSSEIKHKMHQVISWYASM